MAKNVKTTLTFEGDSSNEYIVCRIQDGKKDPQVRLGTVDEEWQLDMTPEEAIDLADEIRRVARCIRAARSNRLGRISANELKDGLKTQRNENGR